MKKIAIIVGHSVRDGGAINANGVNEYHFNNRLAQIIAPKLIENGLEPLIVYRDCTYSELPFKVNDTGADIAVSLHCNAHNTKVSGSEVLHYKHSKKSPVLAELIQQEVLQALGLRDRGLRPVDKAHRGKKGDKGGYLCAMTSMECVIVEPLFIDNPSDLALGEARIDELAQAIVNGVVRYVEK